jgi:predicted DCC family thiol-disulfide oxidoreductase YuxK
VPTFIYDGDCAFCSSCVRYLERWVPSRARIVPSQRVDLGALGVTPQQAATAVQWLGDDGARGSGPVAIGYLLSDAGSFWRAPGWLLRHPPVRWLAWPLYYWVSRNRHRLPGGTAACAITYTQSSDHAT